MPSQGPNRTIASVTVLGSAAPGVMLRAMSLSGTASPGRNGTISVRSPRWLSAAPEVDCAICS